MDWDDLRFALTVAETGSLAAAARKLGVNHTTVLRRVNGLETRLGVRLFERLPGGYAPTVAGAEALAVAGTLGETIDALERRLAGRDLSLSGPLRVTTVDTALVLPHLPEFLAEHPGITVDLVVSGAMANLTRRDADVAVRSAAEVPETLVGRRICGIAFAIYGSSPTADLVGGPWIGLEDTLAETVIFRWLRKLPASTAIACRVDSMIAASQAVQAGLGLALLPCYVGDRTPGLVRLARVPEVQPGLWLLTHEDLRRTARVRVFLDFLARRLASKRDLMEGRQPVTAHSHAHPPSL